MSTATSSAVPTYSPGQTIREVIYLASDLVVGAPDDEIVVRVAYAWNHDRREYAVCGRAAVRGREIWTGDREPMAAEVEYAYRRRCGHSEASRTPFLSANLLGQAIKRRQRLTADQLLADPEFVRLARQAAEKGKTFSADLLEWESKPVVQAAVAVIRAQVEMMRADEAARRAKIAADGAAIRQQDQPTREAVGEAYEACGYRVCRQGHDTVVVIDGRDGSDGQTVVAIPAPGVRCDTFEGDSYSSRCTYRQMDSRHTLRVRGNWLSVVESRGLATHEGKLVLDAEVTGHLADGTPVLTLLRVRQGRGTGLETERVKIHSVAHESVKDADVITYLDNRILHDVLIDLGHEDAAAIVRI